MTEHKDNKKRDKMIEGFDPVAMFGGGSSGVSILLIVVLISLKLVKKL